MMNDVGTKLTTYVHNGRIFCTDEAEVSKLYEEINGSLSATEVYTKPLNISAETFLLYNQIAKAWELRFRENPRKHKKCTYVGCD